jgi:hypothetical protein
MLFTAVFDECPGALKFAIIRGKGDALAAESFCTNCFLI